ncbi:MAG: hypothetical protein Q9209_004701 [Squamulea sp. 1 TL-2023]
MVELERHSTPQSKLSDLTFFLQYVIVLLAIVIAFMLWHDCTTSWKDYDEPSRATGRDYQDWTEEFEEWTNSLEEADENTPLFRRRDEGPLSPDEVLRLSEFLNDETDKLLQSIKEQPLSQDEVSRLTNLIRAADNHSDYGSISSRKRKAAEDADESGDEQLNNTRTQKLKVETDFGVHGTWVSDRLTASPSIMSVEGLHSGYSADCETPFTFRAPHPGRAIISPVKHRK